MSTTDFYIEAKDWNSLSNDERYAFKQYCEFMGISTSSSPISATDHCHAHKVIIASPSRKLIEVGVHCVSNQHRIQIDEIRRMASLFV